MSDIKPKGKFTLGKARETAISAVIVIIALKVVLWALLPYLPILVGIIILFTVLGVALHRTNRF